MGDEQDYGLGEGVCVLCLEEIEAELKAKRVRVGYGPDGRFARLGFDYAHLECAAGSVLDGWIVGDEPAPRLGRPDIIRPMGVEDR